MVGAAASKLLATASSIFLGRTATTGPVAVRLTRKHPWNATVSTASHRRRRTAAA